MQILLTQKEFDDLNEKAKRGENLPSKPQLMEICRRVANEMPVKAEWMDHAVPWKCILDEIDHCCDECPVLDICPHEGKEFSQ